MPRLELQWLEEKEDEEHEREYHEKMKKCFKYRLSQNLPEGKSSTRRNHVAYAQVLRVNETEVEDANLLACQIF